MTRRRKTKWPRGERFIGIQLWEFESPAFQALSADATRVYLFMRRRCNFDGSNNGQVVFSQRDATKALNAGDWRRGSNALAELRHHGFIKLRSGGAMGEAIRLACEWHLTAFECGGQPASKDFARWDGIVFEPPYRSKLGAKTAQNRAAEKQAPTCNIQTPPSATSRRSELGAPRNDAQNGKSVCNIQTVREGERLQHPDTCTITRGKGLRKHTPDGAAEPAKKRPWRAPTHVEMTRADYESWLASSATLRAKAAHPPKTADLPKAPPGNAKDKARWLREHLATSMLTSQAVASALGIESEHVDELAAGRSGLGIASWRKLVALAEQRMN